MRYQTSKHRNPIESQFDALTTMLPRGHVHCADKFVDKRTVKLMKRFFPLLFFSAKSKRAGTGKSRFTPVPTPEDNTCKPAQYSDGEPGDDSDYDTDLEYEEPREEYDPTGDQENTYKDIHRCLSPPTF